MVPPKLKMVDLSARVRRRNLFDSAQEQSTAFVNQHSECLQEGKKPSEKQKKRAEQCISKYRTQRAIPPFSCLFYSKCHSVSESAFGALRQRCRCSTWNIYRRGQMGVGFTRALAGVQKITLQPPLADWKLLKTITATTLIERCPPHGHAFTQKSSMATRVSLKALITLISLRSSAGPHTQCFSGWFGFHLRWNAPVWTSQELNSTKRLCRSKVTFLW